MDPAKSFLTNRYLSRINSTLLIRQLTDIPSFPMHIIMAIFMQLKIVNAYLEAGVKK
jgi:hypothetical protein